ncbi:2-octaprenyl-6-methoxyphenol hydroxylase /2-octaprenyl-3-methyl-6-methoxy-1,4-benzoquinol hydroxylase [Arboricoccus pini]|uniref:2-octaprenyl-6-methoxyphenol hydroxylase /2-octaprenyl-3-methyl-6-methoxy-1,4-benzoquinol hydroxylase n=1 Tax=Arboricoccus pini TaxID=1963835 RepID=A0A212R0E1_9PROT|nr:UbiH/UbiF/VisC/COQ6 family ubiquinone biosynthesis hydroxylase [Arboricoccus pini]SNB65468.1 2-octaprenyl-6-methoxyphenol hydroxylase /2-octaprenyl-3-methyl-6-methoxy-1,4-benzoquinol hydroxylase [Arboricoccus pini]
MSAPISAPETADDVAETDVLIVGAGLTGLTLACALGNSKIRAILVERRAFSEILEPKADGRVTAVARSTQTMLDRLNVWRSMAPDAQRIDDIVVGETSWPSNVHYDHRDVGGEPLGWIVPNAMMRAALVARLRACPSIQVRESAAVTELGVDGGKAYVHLSNGKTIRSSVIAVCEGKSSATRELAGIGVTHWDYKQDGIVCTFVHERPHLNRAFERFYSDGPIATLPMTDDDDGRHRTSIVWALDRGRAKAIAALDDDQFEVEVMDRVGLHLGRMHLASRRWHYPLSLVWSKAYAAPRLMLVGDCARGIHPLAGQGWNVGARDVAAAAEVILDRMSLGLDPGDEMAIERYERWRRFDSLALVGITDGLNRLFNNDILPVKLARNLGLAAVQRTKPLKQLFVRHAMGLAGDLPDLMRS